MKHASLSFRIWLRAEIIYIFATMPLLADSADVYMVSAALAVVCGLLNLVIFILTMSVQEGNISSKPGWSMAAVYACAIISNVPGLLIACKMFLGALSEMWPLPAGAMICGIVSVATYKRALYRYFHGVLSHSI